jgi:hypothetical protein
MSFFQLNMQDYIKTSYHISILHKYHKELFNLKIIQDHVYTLI